MIADISFTPVQLYTVLGVIVFLLGTTLLVRQVFNFSSKDDLQKVESSIRLELEKHSNARHEMRRELAAVTATLIKVETMLTSLNDQLKRILK